MINSTKQSQIKRVWHLVDAKNQILGRLASKITPLLIGKFKPYYAKNLDCGDFVVVINASEIKVTGKKETEKRYTSYSGYPGGLTVRTYAELKEKFPERIVEKAIFNMLPDNKLKRERRNRLHVFAGNEHTFKDKFNVKGEKKNG